MSILNNYDFEHLKNEAESLVLNELDSQLELCDESVCLCSDCVLDMATLALNAVKPLYRYSLLGSLYAASAMTDEAYAASIKKAVAVAIEKVRANPGHVIQPEQ